MITASPVQKPSRVLTRPPAAFPLAAPPPSAFTVVTERLNAERKLFKDKLAAGVAPLHALLARHLQAFMTCPDGWQLHGEFARAAAGSCTELTLLLPSREALPGGDGPTTNLLEGVHTACGALMRGQPLAGDPGGPSALAAWKELGGRAHERLAAMVTAHMAACPLPFGPLLPHFLGLFVGNALVAADADTLRAMRPKRRVLLVRFIAKALLCPYYRAEWLEVNIGMLQAGGWQSPGGRSFASQAACKRCNGWRSSVAVVSPTRT